MDGGLMAPLLFDAPLRGCVQCGRAFWFKQSKRVYCGKNCQQKAYRARLAMGGNYNQITGRPLVSSRRAA